MVKLSDRESTEAPASASCGPVSTESRRRARTAADQASEVVLGERRTELASVGAGLEAGEGRGEALRGVAGESDVSLMEEFRVMPRTASAPARSVGREARGEEAGERVAGEDRAVPAWEEEEFESASKSRIRSCAERPVRGFGTLRGLVGWWARRAGESATWRRDRRSRVAGEADRLGVGEAGGERSAGRVKRPDGEGVAREAGVRVRKTTAGRAAVASPPACRAAFLSSAWRLRLAAESETVRRALRSKEASAAEKRLVGWVRGKASMFAVRVVAMASKKARKCLVAEAVVADVVVSVMAESGRRATFIRCRGGPASPVEALEGRAGNHMVDR